jgi:hypothetical protein
VDQIQDFHLDADPGGLLPELTSGRHDKQRGEYAAVKAGQQEQEAPLGPTVNP